MRDDVLSESHRAALRALKPAADHGYYLAGGTALGLHLAHRRSLDLDLFRTREFDADTMVSELAGAGVRLGSVRTSRASIRADVEGVRTNLLCFPYAPLDPFEPSPEGVPVASLRDVAAMKIEAIAARGARRDFYDLYFICHAGLSLDQVLSAHRERFARADPDPYHRLRALTFFDDAEREPEPMLLKVVDFTAVRAFFAEEAKRIWEAGRTQ
jgi:hypothetical protein